VAEAAAPAPYLNIFNWPHEGWKGTALTRGADGKPVQVGDASVPGCSANFGRAQALAKKKGLLREGRLGDAKVLLFDAQRVLDLVAGRIRREPDYLLCPLTTCRACDERRTVFERAESPGADFVGEFLTDLIAKAPYRFAGSAGERKGAEEIARRMTAAGLSNVHLEEFPTLTWDGALSEVKVKVNGRWETVPSGVLAHSPSTGGKAVVGKAVHVESVADLDKVRDARNSIGVLWDGYGESVGQFRSLMRKGFKALILSDGRFNHRDVVAEGVPG
jgi:hypothetical protein